MDDLDKPRESAEQKAKRKWGNHDLTKRFLEEKRKPPPVVKANPDIAEVITNERPKADVTTKFERQFIQELREMLDGHTRRNLIAYKASLRAQIYRLKLEKYKRLLAKDAERKAALPLAQPKSKDLFS